MKLAQVKVRFLAHWMEPSEPGQGQAEEDPMENARCECLIASVASSTEQEKVSERYEGASI